MGQVLTNLILNASQAMPEGGQIFIAASQDKGFCLLTVTDTGTGIPPEVLPRILEPFFTTKEAGKGAGLGLSLCKSIVSAHGGFIVIESAVDKGTTCSIRLPL